jgi:hypothetical protein
MECRTGRDVNAPINIASCNILGDCQDQIIAATESQLEFAQEASIRRIHLTTFVFLHVPMEACLGRRQTTWAAFAYW